MNKEIRLLHAPNCPIPNFIPPIGFCDCCICGARIKEEGARKIEIELINNTKTYQEALELLEESNK